MSSSSLEDHGPYAASPRKREQRLSTIAVYSALCFMAVIVLASLQHQLF